MKSGLAAAAVSVGSAILVCTGAVAGNAGENAGRTADNPKSAEVNTVFLPPIVNFVPAEKLGGVYSTPHLAALCRLPVFVELLPTSLLEPVFTGIIKDASVATTPGECRNGIFRAESPYNAFDYRYVITLIIKDGKILAADYDEVNRAGKGKQGDAEYCKEMEKSGTTPAIAYPLYEQRLLKTQDIMKVDAVTGATYSLYRFRIVAALALSEAKRGK